jgi:DNA polymerase I
MKTATLVTCSKELMDSGDTLILPCTVNYYFISTDEQVREAVSILLPIVTNPNNTIALDVETTGLDPFLDDIILLQIGTADNRQYIFNYRHINVDLLKPLLETDCWKLGHNLKFDIEFIKQKLHTNTRQFFDTMLAEYVIKGAKRNAGYSLDAVIKNRLSRELRVQTTGFSVKGDAAETAKQVMQSSFIGLKPDVPLTSAQLAYAAQDVSAETIFEVAKQQTKELKKTKPNMLYDSAVEGIRNQEIVAEYKRVFPPQLSLWQTALLEFKFLEVVIDMELAGIGFSPELHKQFLTNILTDYTGYKAEFLKHLSQIPGQQKTLFGTASVNPSSTDQVIESLNRLKLRLRDTKADTLDNKLLELTEGSLEYKLVSSLLKYRGVDKLVSSFGEKLAAHIHPVTHRIHFSVLQMVETGRISNRQPNCQQIPKSIEWRKTGNAEKDAALKERLGLRECFQAKPGYRFIIYDYSQQELRVAAAISRDKNMIDAFLYGKELHSYSATLMYGGDYNEFVQRVKAKDPETVKQRSEAKVISFGALYGSGPSNFSRKLHITMERAQDILTRFWAAYPNLKKAMEKYGNTANELKFSNTVLGRRRYYDDIADRIFWVKGLDKPAAVQKKIEDEKMDWFTEKHGPVTEENMVLAKKSIMNKYRGEINRQAGNHTIQGTSADITKLAAVKIRNDFISKNLDATIVGLVHDEIIVEARLDLVEDCDKIVSSRMKEALNTFCPTVPAEADGTISTCWKKD